jgi:hypothetical protein
MTKPKATFILILVFVVTAILSFFFENSFDETIRYLYSSLTYNKISFIQPRKYIHFASNLFVTSFGLYVTILSYLIFTQTTKQKVLNCCLTISLFPITVVLYSYFDSTIKLLQCTACDNGTMTLTYSDISYDKTFVISLIISLLPFLTTEFKKIMQTRNQT